MEDSASESNRNTLNDSDLGHETGRIEDYFFNFDEKIEARYLYYNAFITKGASTIDQPTLLDPYRDTLNFHTFPYWLHSDFVNVIIPYEVFQTLTLIH